MVSPFELALNHQKRRIRIGQVATAQALATWRMSHLDSLDASWNVIAPVLVDVVSEAQIVSAQQADPYFAAAAQQQGKAAAARTVEAAALSGVMIDGREVGPAMYGAVTNTKTLIGKGLPAERAFEAGASFLASIVQSAIADAGRQADSVAAATHKYTMYVRVVSAGACSRCAILAGQGEYEKAFKRHPSCKCTTYPVDSMDEAPIGLHASPDDYFKSLSLAEQNRVFTNAGAQAIRDGADPIGIVNARRGATLRGGGLVENSRQTKRLAAYDSLGNPIRAFTTGEGTSIRGAYGRAQYRRNQELTKGVNDRYRRTVNARLMPETIYAMAGGNQAKAVELLTQYGYIN